MLPIFDPHPCQVHRNGRDNNVVLTRACGLTWTTLEIRKKGMSFILLWSID